MTEFQIVIGKDIIKAPPSFLIFYLSGVRELVSCITIGRWKSDSEMLHCIEKKFHVDFIQVCYTIFRHKK